MLEEVVEDHFVASVEMLGGRAFKFIVKNVRGIPDRVVFIPMGIFLLVELKRPKGGRLSTPQRLLHKWFRSIGFPVHTLYTIEAVDTLMEQVARRQERAR